MWCMFVCHPCFIFSIGLAKLHCKIACHCRQSFFLTSATHSNDLVLFCCIELFIFYPFPTALILFSAKKNTHTYEILSSYLVFHVYTCMGVYVPFNMGADLQSARFKMKKKLLGNVPALHFKYLQKSNLCYRLIFKHKHSCARKIVLFPDCFGPPSFLCNIHTPLHPSIINNLNSHLCVHSQFTFALRTASFDAVCIVHILLNFFLCRSFYWCCHTLAAVFCSSNQLIIRFGKRFCRLLQPVKFPPSIALFCCLFNFPCPYSKAFVSFLLSEFRLM